ncbi:MAG: hypothetical protein MMC23_002833 [Stictis urceolatum]|nr:hypothetical protein [Stictis urceolata]
MAAHMESLGRMPPYSPVHESDEREGIMGSDIVLSLAPRFAARCDVYACIRTYEAEIRSGVLSESLLSTARNWSQSTPEDQSSEERYEEYLSRTVRVGCLTPRTRARLLADNLISDHTEWMAWNGTCLGGTEDENIGSATQEAIPSECVFQWSRSALLENFFSLPEASEYGSNDTSALLEIQRGNLSNVPDNLEAHFKPRLDFFSQGLESLLNNGALTFESRGKLDPKANYPELDVWKPSGNASKITRVNNSPALGVTHEMASCIHVRWVWLTLPSGLIVATIIFFACMVIQAAPEAEHSTWKSSPLALLWHGLEGPVKREGAWLDTRQAMEKRAKEVRVRLRTTDKGRRLVQYTDDHD